MSNMDIRESMGPDGTHPCMLRKMADVILRPH